MKSCKIDYSPPAGTSRGGIMVSLYDAVAGLIDNSLGSDRIDEIKSKASKFGDRVRDAEDAEREDSRAEVRREWIKFRNTLQGRLRDLAVEAYFRAYAR